MSDRSTPGPGPDRATPDRATPDRATPDRATAPVHGVHLRRTDERVDEVAALPAACGGAVGVDGVLHDLDRRLRRAVPTGLKVWRSWAWDRADAFSRRWWPQGITTSLDATGTGRGLVAGREVVVASWYSHAVDGITKGVRISFADVNARRYRHVLLVVPKVVDGQVTFTQLKAHAGGIVWVGPWLYVAGTRKGIHVFRMSDLVRIPDALFDEDAGRIGHNEDRLSSFGYRYVLPLRFSYRAAADEGEEPLRYSFLSLDRDASGPTLVVGEYGRRQQTTRLARFDLDPETWLLPVDEEGYSRPLLLEGNGQRGMQGACVVGGTWYLTASHGPWGLGTLYVGRPGAWRAVRGALPMGPEDIAYVPATDSLWSVTEHPGRRWIYKLRRPRA
jgi:hypothetical protein